MKKQPKKLCGTFGGGEPKTKAAQLGENSQSVHYNGPIRLNCNLIIQAKSTQTQTLDANLKTTGFAVNNGQIIMKQFVVPKEKPTTIVGLKTTSHLCRDLRAKIHTTVAHLQ